VHVDDAHLARSNNAAGYVGIKQRQIKEGIYVYDIEVINMLPSSATAMQKEQLKRKARAMGYTTLAFDTALAAARARHAIMDGSGRKSLARLSSHGCHLAAATTVPGPFRAEELVANRRFWSGQLQMQGATSEAADATVAEMMDEDLASLVKNAQTAILQKATLGHVSGPPIPSSAAAYSWRADDRSQNTLNTGGESSREGGHVHDAYLQRSERSVTGYVGVFRREITDGTYVYDAKEMLPKGATPQMKEQLKQKARDMGYKTMTFNTALAAARARRAIMDV